MEKQSEQLRGRERDGFTSSSIRESTSIPEQDVQSPEGLIQNELKNITKNIIVTIISSNIDNITNAELD